MPDQTRDVPRNKKPVNHFPHFATSLTKTPSELAFIAQKIRRHVIEMIAGAGSGHPGGSLGLADVMTGLYFAVLKQRPHQPDWPERDYFLLSNGHVCPVWYATLAQAGYFPLEELGSLRQFGSRLQGHPHQGSLPGVENTSGLLGQGLSLGCGLTTAFKLDHKSNHIFVQTSDAEHQEGQIWEAYRYAGAHHLTHLTVLIDRNDIQIDGTTQEIAPLEPLAEKITSCNWQVVEIDGHNFDQISWALNGARTCHLPTAIICHTTAGKDVSFMENNPDWHGRAPNQAEAKQALDELNQTVHQNKPAGTGHPHAQPGRGPEGLSSSRPPLGRGLAGIQMVCHPRASGDPEGLSSSRQRGSRSMRPTTGFPPLREENDSTREENDKARREMMVIKKPTRGRKVTMTNE